MTSERRSTWAVIAGSAAVSVLIRLRRRSPMSVDEGAHLAIAPGRAHGKLVVSAGVNAQYRLVGYLDVPPRRPHFVAETQRPSACDSSGRGGRIRRRSDQPVAVGGNVIILEPDRAAIVAKSQRAGSL